MQIDIVIITPIKEEYEAIRLHLYQIKRQQGKKTNFIYEVGRFNGATQTHTIAIFQKGKGIVPIALVTERILATLKPTYLFLVGTAGGRKKVTIGDIVIGTKAYNYESGKELNTSFSPRPQVRYASEALIDLAKIVGQDQQWKNRLANNSTLCKVVAGPIASGDKVIESVTSNVSKIINNHYPDTIALDMEAHSFLEATSKYPSSKCLILRGISDLLTDKQTANRWGSRELASTNVAAFTFEVIYQLPKYRKENWIWYIGVISSLLLVVYYFSLIGFEGKDIPINNKPLTADTLVNDKPDSTLILSQYTEPEKTLPSPTRIAPKKLTFSLSSPLPIKLVRQLEQQLNRKYSAEIKNNASTITFQYTGTFEANHLNDQLHYYSGGYLEILINDIICCCPKNKPFRLPSSHFPGNNLTSEKAHIDQLLQKIIHDNFDELAEQIKNCL